MLSVLPYVQQNIPKHAEVKKSACGLLPGTRLFVVPVPLSTKSGKQQPLSTMAFAGGAMRMVLAGEFFNQHHVYKTIIYRRGKRGIPRIEIKPMSFFELDKDIEPQMCEGLPYDVDSINELPYHSVVGFTDVAFTGYIAARLLYFLLGFKGPIYKKVLLGAFAQCGISGRAMTAMLALVELLGHGSNPSRDVVSSIIDGISSVDRSQWLRALGLLEAITLMGATDITNRNFVIAVNNSTIIYTSESFLINDLENKLTEQQTHHCMVDNLRALKRIQSYKRKLIKVLKSSLRKRYVFTGNAS